MEKKTDSEFSKARNFRELDESLKNAFSNIKSDMNALREGMHQQGIKISEIKHGLKDDLTDTVTVDKFNILKIKVGELNEELKKVWELEKALEDMEKKGVTASEFNNSTKEISCEIAEMKKELKALNDNTATEEQIKGLVKDVNSEFDAVKRGIEELRLIKDTITKAELEKRTDELNRRSEKLNDEFDMLKSEVKAGLKGKIDAVAVEGLVNDINSEFDDLKVMIAKVKEGEGRFASISDVDRKIVKLEKKLEEISLANASSMEDFSKGIESAFKDFMKANDSDHSSLAKEREKLNEKAVKSMSDLKGSLNSQLDDLKGEMKTLMTRRQAENLIADINKEFDGVKAGFDKGMAEVGDIKRNFSTRKELASELMKMKNAIDKLAYEISAVRKESATKAETHSLFEELKALVLGLNNALKSKIDMLVKRIKKDNDYTDKSIKANSQDISSVDKSFHKELKAFIHEKEFAGELGSLWERLDRISDKLESMDKSTIKGTDFIELDKRLKSQAKDAKESFVGKREFEKLVGAIDVLQEQLEMQNDLLADKRKEIKVYAKELKAAKKAEKKLMKYEAIEEKEAKRHEVKDKGPVVPYRKTGIFAKFLIGSAFVVLVSAIGFFFSGLSGMTDMLAVIAVILFVTGIAIRILIGLKQN